MKLQQVLSRVRKAVDDYNMIEEGDCIAVGISGGKDSLTLLQALAALRRFYPNKFTLKAITIDLGFNNMNLDDITAMCKELDVEYHIEKTDIAQIVFDERKENSPCSLCAKMRKGALNEAIKAMGCNKVAYAHHKDDVVETMLLSLFYEGRFHCFSPVTYLDRSDVIVIRPLIYMNEADVVGFIRRYNIPVVKSPCPVDKKTKRECVHQLVKELNKDIPSVRNRMFTAITDSELPGWSTKKDARY
ncbi:MAG: tRNA 2-thiocytidine(32) synthetase TtcA [Lachnospiraceae bacterium]|nr:tRNA 2-thiocytidine(32) synthetase TtcA [Lachnospiraceae bacterium]